MTQYCFARCCMSQIGASAQYQQNVQLQTPVLHGILPSQLQSSANSFSFLTKPRLLQVTGCIRVSHQRELGLGFQANPGSRIRSSCGSVPAAALLLLTVTDVKQGPQVGHVAHLSEAIAGSVQFPCQGMIWEWLGMCASSCASRQLL